MRLGSALTRPPARVKPEPSRFTPPAEGLPRVQQRILNEAAVLETIGVLQPTRLQLAAFCGYTNPKSGGFTEPVGELVEGGYLVSPAPGRLALTDQGRTAAAVVDPPGSSAELQERIAGRLDGPRQRILLALLAHYPDPVARPELAAELHYTNPKSGGFTEPLGHLVRLGWAESPRPGFVVASSLLFLEGR